MKKLTLILAVLLCMASILTAQTLKPMVAVSTFDVKGEITKNEADIITELFITELVSKGTVNVVDRENFDKIVKEMKFQASDWSNSKKTAELGKVINATAVVRGQLMKMGNIFITATIIDINTAQILSSARYEVATISQIYGILPKFCEQISMKLPKIENEPLIGKWRCMVYTKRKYSQYRYVWFNSYGIQSSWSDYPKDIPVGELLIEFKADKTIKIHDFTYYELECDFEKNINTYTIGKVISREEQKTEKGIGFWTCTGKDDRYRYYKLQLDTDTKKNMSISLEAYFPSSNLNYNDSLLAIPNAYKYYDFTWTNNNNWKRKSDYILTKNSSPSFKNVYVQFSDWIKVNDF